MRDTAVGRSYYYGTIGSLKVRKANGKAFYAVATLGGGDAGDSWTSFVFLHIAANCRATVLSKVYSSIHCNGACEGIEMKYHFLDRKTVEVMSTDRAVRTTSKKYDLQTLYNNPQARVFPSKIEKAEALLGGGADINTKEQDGTTPLMWGAKEGDIELVNALLDQGAEVEAKDNDGHTSLMWAALNDRCQMIDRLIEKGSEVNAKDATGWTALMIAAWKGYVEAVRILLDKGADVNAKAKDGRTALRIAEEKGHKEVAELLKARGAKE